MAGNSKVLEKLRKLMAMANTKSGASQAEMEAFLSKARELARENNIDLETVGEGETKAKGMTAVCSVVKTKTTYERTYHMPIMRVLRECFDIRTIMSSYWTANAQKVYVGISFVGEETDVEVSKIFWDYLQDLFPRCCKEYKANGGGSEHTSAWTTERSYYEGLAQGICEANRRERAAMPADQKGKFQLVLVNKHALVEAKTAELFPRLRNVRSFQKSHDSSASAAGYARGKEVKLNRQLS